MSYIGLLVTIAVIAGAVVLVGRSIAQNARARAALIQNDPRIVAQEHLGVVVSRAAVAGALVLAIVLTFGNSVHAIDAGHVGVVYTFGAITNQTNSGLAVTLPWQEVRQASIQVQKYSDASIAAASKETQNLSASITLNYQVSPIAIQKLYTTVGPNYQDVLIPSRVNNFFKEEAVKYPSTDVLPHREDIRIAVRDKLSRELEPYSITVNDLLIDNIHFDDAFTRAIEEKQVATQNAQAEQNKVAVSEAQARQKAATAQGDANALRINAQGQADANKALSASLTPELIQFQALQKLAPNVQIALLPSGQGLILDPSTFLKAATSSPPTR